MVSTALSLPGAFGFDYAALATPARTSTIASKPPAGFTTAKVPLPGLGAAALSTRLAEIRARKNLIDPTAAEIKRAGSDKDLQAAFTLHRAVDGLRTLAQAASEKSLSAATRAQLQSQFASGVAEVEKYLAQAPTNKLILQFGAKVSRAESASVAKIPTAYTGIGVVKGSRSDVILGVTGAEQFTLRVTKAGRSDTIAINLSEISGPITLDSVKILVNSKIAALPLLDANNNPVRDGNGAIVPRYASRLDVVRTNTLKETPATFALRADTSTAEQISFTDVNATPSAYILRTTDGATALRRIDDMSTAVTQNRVADLSAREARATAVDSTGAIYVVGTTKAEIGGQAATSANDIFLAKYDSNGVLQFARKLGAAGTAQGTAIAIDSANNVIVAGDFNGKLGSGDLFSGTDALVIKYNSQGEELFARSFDSSVDDSITGISIAPDDSIVVTGTTNGALPGQAQKGSTDNFTAVLNSSTGALLARQQFGTAAADKPAAIAHAADGALLQASVENGDIILRRFAGGDITGLPTEFNLGAIGSGAISDIAVDPVTGGVVIAGTTTLSVGGAVDGFIARLDSALTLQGITKLGASTSATISNVAFSNGDIFATGRTTSVLGSAIAGITDGFLARLDGATGVIAHISQFGVAGKRSDTPAVVIAPQGPGALLKLGLRQGDLRAVAPPALVEKTILRAGDSFDVAINGGTARTIRIDGDDTMAALATKIRTQLGSTATVTVQENAGGTKISITAKSATRIDLRRGPEGADLLGKIGIAPGQLRDGTTLFDIGKSAVDVARKPGGAFALNLDRATTLSDPASSGAAVGKMNSALESVQRAYRSLYYDPTREALARERAVAGPVPAYLTRQLSNYQDALARLQAGNSNFGFSS